MGAPGARWTRVNFAEAVQGVQRPLDWTFWQQGLELSLRQTFCAMGALSGREAALPCPTERRFSAAFYGRVAGNVDMFRYVADRLPGSSADQLEEKMFGKPAPAEPARKELAALARYPVVAVKMPRALAAPLFRLPRVLEANRAWWRRSVLDAPPDGATAARGLLRDACRRFNETLVLHGVPTMLSGQILDALGDLAEGALGDRSLGLALATGLGEMEETGLIDDVFRVSRGTLSVEELIGRHGNHGPEEGKLSSFSWREERAHLNSFLATYRSSQPGDPCERERAQRARRAEVEASLMAALPAVRRPAARLVMGFARRYIPLREVSKASYLLAIDGGRCAARVIGRELAAYGSLADPEDVFFLTLSEALDPVARDYRDVVAERHARDVEYRALEIPLDWTGQPVPIAPSAGSQAVVRELRGLGVFGEEPVSGRARVVTDPTTATLEDGEILVCATTDPSWTPLFMVAGALVIDTGGPISHGAIVARELGVTCVINTGTGTREIPDGAQITVDGRHGLVTVEPVS